MFDAPRKCAAAHHPGIGMEGAAFLASGEYRDLAQRSEFVAIAYRCEGRARTSQLPAPLHVSVADSVQVELVGFVDQFENSRVIVRSIEVERYRGVCLLEKILGRNAVKLWKFGTA